MNGAYSRPILVTGAGGYLGEYLSRVLVGRGASVAGTIHRRTATIPAAQLLRLDLRDRTAVRALFSAIRPSAVIHCAAMTAVADCEANPREAFEAIIGVTGNLLAARREADGRIPFIHVSTDLVFDGRNGPYTEESEPNPLSIYGRCKLESERIVLEHPATVVVRSALLFGPRGTNGTSFLGWMVDEFRQGRPVDLFVDEYRTPLFVAELAEVLCKLAEGGYEGLYHAGGPERLSRAELGELVCRAGGWPESLVRRRCLAESRYPAPRPADVCLDSSKLMNLLQWRPTSFADALVDPRLTAALRPTP